MRVIREIVSIVGVLLVVLGLVVCMCETAEMSMQLSTTLYGMAIMVAGVIICFLSTEGGCEYGG